MVLLSTACPTSPGSERQNFEYLDQSTMAMIYEPSTAHHSFTGVTGKLLDLGMLKHRSEFLMQK